MEHKNPPTTYYLLPTKRAFTLIEIVIALAMLVIGLTGVLALFPTGMVASKRAGDLNMAAIVAEGTLANIRRVGVGVYGVYTDGWHRKPGASETVATYQSENPNVASSINVSTPPGAPGGLRKVIIRVFTADPGGDVLVTFPDGSRKRAMIDDFITYVAEK